MSLPLPFRDSVSRDEAFSAYLDGELDLQDRLALEAWLGNHPEERQRLEAFMALGTSLRTVFPPGEIPTGWTLRAYQIGAPMPPLGRPVQGHPWALQAMLRHSAQAWVRGHGVGSNRTVVGRHKIMLKRRG